jgi:hypothetical protein
VSTVNAVKVRVPRFAENAVERARLTVVPQRAFGRTQAARTPFAVLVLGLLAAGVVGLLMFNTSMQQASFTATKLQQQVTALTAQQQGLDMQLDALRDPQQLAVAAKKLGMVPASEPAFIRLSDGKVLGNPTPATPADAVRINPLDPQKPASLAPKPIVIKVPWTPTADPTVNSKVGTGAASTTVPPQRDRKNQSATQSTTPSTTQPPSGATE